MKSKPLSHDRKTPETIDRNWWWLVYGRITKGIPPLRGQKISTKSQEEDDKIKRKVHTADMNWNDWKFQLHWNKLE